jgi:hypothetical protein
MFALFGRLKDGKDLKLLCRSFTRLTLKTTCIGCFVEVGRAPRPAFFLRSSPPYESGFELRFKKENCDVES